MRILPSNSQSGIFNEPVIMDCLTDISLLNINLINLMDLYASCIVCRYFEKNLISYTFSLTLCEDLLRIVLIPVSLLFQIGKTFSITSSLLAGLKYVFINFFNKTRLPSAILPYLL